VAEGGRAVGAGAAVGPLLGERLGGTVVTVSGGSWDVLVGAGEALGGIVVCGADGVLTAVRDGIGGATVPLVVALSPLLMMTAVPMAQIAMSAPPTAAMGRQRPFDGHARSP
jgi:hypothetical protein